MKSRRVLIVVCTIVVPLLLVFGLASCIGIPPLRADFSHQGRLLTSSGAVVPDGNYTIRYRLFHSTIPDATPLYTETKTVAVTGGLFDTSVGLTGVITPEIFSRPTWLEIAVNGEVLSPRHRLEGAPYASSLVEGAVIQGSVPITRTFSSYNNIGANLTLWNQDDSIKGGNGLVIFNSAQATGPSRSSVAALQAIALETDSTASSGEFGAIIRSDNYAGLYVKGTSPYVAALFDGSINVLGTCFGCTMAYTAQNNGAEAIQVGDFVAADGVVTDPDLNIPIMQVHKAASASDAIVGVATGAMVRNPVGDFYGTTTGGFEGLGGPAASGQYLGVAVQGLVQANLSQAATLQIGDWIAMDSGQMIAAQGDAPKVGRLMSSVDETGMAWVMLSGQ